MNRQRFSVCCYSMLVELSVVKVDDGDDFVDNDDDFPWR